MNKRVNMKSFGLIGGTSWRSTVEYYSLINDTINKHFKNNTNPPIYISSLNQNQIHEYQRSDDWDAITELYIEKSIDFQKLDVKGIAFCANTPHKVYSAVQERVQIPILHIADAIAASLKIKNIQTIGLLGTKFTMQDEFIRQRLLEDHGIRSIVPSAEEQTHMQDYLYREFSVGIFNEEAKRYFENVITNLSNNGAKAVVLGCTEFPILLKGYLPKLELVDSLKSHCSMIIDFILDSKNSK